MTYLYVSGIDNEPKLKACQRRGVKRVLISYEYIRNKRNADEWLTKYDFAWMIDSGAFTLNQSKPGKKYCQKYLEEYLEFLDEHKDIIVCAAGMDLDYAVGVQESIAWEEEFDYLEAEGLPIIHVWHPPRGHEDWKRMTEQHSWVGIAAEVAENSPETMPGMVASARTNLAKVHGFAITRTSNSRIPFFSMDSSSWMMGAQFGQTYVFDGGQLRQIEKSERSRFMQVWMDAGIPKALIEKDHYTATYEMNLLAFQKWEAHLQQIHHPERMDVKPRVPGWFDKTTDTEVIAFGETVFPDSKLKPIDYRDLGKVLSKIIRRDFDGLGKSKDTVEELFGFFDVAVDHSDDGLEELRRNAISALSPVAEMWTFREDDLEQTWETRDGDDLPPPRPEGRSVSFPLRDARY